LDVSKVYSSLSLFALLADPFLSLVMALMSFLGSVGSFVRIQTFLNKDSHEDCRNPRFRDSHATLVESNVKNPSGVSSVLTLSPDIPQSLKKISLPPWDILMFEGASFGWELSQDPILKDITLKFPVKGFSVLVGPSGCGKSTLLKALLGEVPCIGGTVELSSESVAYCDQTPWHMNGSIRDSIIALSVFDSNWYASVIRACALEEDLAQFPKRDQAVIGSRGVALSGGQSQRIVSKF
jgi:ATP-binding cassette subfamily C (CFTR/MRP) protein 1